jgi:hypothetical protein
MDYNEFMKDNIIALTIVLAIYSAIIWGIPLALGIEVLPYWKNAFNLFFIPILIYFVFRKDGLYSILKDTHQFNIEQVKQDEEELKRQFVD